MSVNQKILDAIELITSNSIQKAGYDRTIQAQIISCEDPAIGKYKCKYQDATIYAYSNDVDKVYSNKSSVYILIPGNDMSKEKTILGSADKLGLNYIPQGGGEELYNINGTNCISSTRNFWLDTSNQNYLIKIYDCNDVEDSPLKFKTNSIEQYLKQSSSIIIGATISTSIAAQKQLRGSYGLIFNLVFKDSSSREVIRSYVLDENHMQGNPYKMVSPTRQYEIFDIDNENFVRIESVEIFNTNFPEANQTSTDLLTRGDIKLTKLELYGASRMEQTEINGVAISFYTPQGTFFLQDDASSAQKTITAQVRIKGRLVTNTSQISFYWGSQHVGVSSRSQDYNRYLGKGWKCLNDKKIVSPATATDDPVIEWIPGQDTYRIKKSAATAKDNKIKVAILYEDNLVTKEINIQNLTDSVAILTITSNSGTVFHNDIGSPSLTCTCIYNKVNKTDSCTFSWGYEDHNGIFHQLPQTVEENTTYTQTNTALINLEDQIKREVAFPNASQPQLDSYNQILKELSYVQRVDKNHIYNIRLNYIINFCIFKCSVYEGSIYRGTASLKIINLIENEDVFTLVINHGNEVFQYNEFGVAPNSKSLEKPQQIEALTFSIFDKTGQEIDIENWIRSGESEIEWKFPITNTLLTQLGQSTGTYIQKADDPDNHYYKDLATLVYDIEQKYDFKKIRNQISLTVKYKNRTLMAQTNFTFLKQGESGTNGTDYTVRMVPNTNAFVYLPTFTQVGDSKYVINYHLNGNKDGQDTVGVSYGHYFNVELWRKGDLLWKGYSAKGSNDPAALDGLSTSKPTDVTFEVLQNIYGAVKKSGTVTNASGATIEVKNENQAKDATNLGIYPYETSPNTDRDTYRNYVSVFNRVEPQLTNSNTPEQNFSQPRANIVKCTFTLNEKKYYATMPFATAWVVDDNYRIKLKQYTGFKYVVYDSDGSHPEYDSSKPFEFIVERKINGVWEDVSLTTTGTYSLTFTYQVQGTVKKVTGTSTIQTIASNNLERLTSSIYGTLNKNQCLCRPSARYNGECVNNRLVCTVKRGSTIVARMAVPIHFYINRYGLANLNDWDGNSIQINHNGGYILAPQMGAGVKNADNSFTGIVMGEVRRPNLPANIGLLGFAAGYRTLFLNSENGVAIFGKYQQSQITIDPSSNIGRLYSGDFWKNWDEETELPSNYKNTNENGSGLLIEFSAQPRIKFGNGVFEVNGKTKTGTISGWKLTENAIQSDGGKITLNAATNNEFILVKNTNGKTFFKVDQSGLILKDKNEQTVLKADQDGVSLTGSIITRDVNGDRTWIQMANGYLEGGKGSQTYTRLDFDADYQGGNRLVLWNWKGGIDIKYLPKHADEITEPNEKRIMSVNSSRVLLRYYDSQLNLTSSETTLTSHSIEFLSDYGIHFGIGHQGDAHLADNVVFTKGYATFNVEINNSSDQRLKTNIILYNNKKNNSILNKIKNISTYSFDWKDSQKRHPHVNLGFIAQNFQKIFPDLVNEDDKKFLSINNIGLIPYLVEAIKELDNKIQYLESREKNNG